MSEHPASAPEQAALGLALGLSRQFNEMHERGERATQAQIDELQAAWKPVSEAFRLLLAWPHFRKMVDAKGDAVGWGDLPPEQVIRSNERLRWARMLESERTRLSAAGKQAEAAECERWAHAMSYLNEPPFGATPEAGRPYVTGVDGPSHAVGCDFAHTDEAPCSMPPDAAHASAAERP